MFREGKKCSKPDFFFLFGTLNVKANGTIEKYKLAASTSSPSNQHAYLIVRVRILMVTKGATTTSSFTSNM